MHVKSMVIDGFKSYGRRVEIKQFDPSFNAITGLNGTGKSNILDALCFVMGISNLSSVRAHSLEELVYKQGQANVNKASVTVTFDNSNKEQSPPGYEDRDEITITRQVVIGGKNKYMINGITVQNTRVADLFKSVQLNVNNPHFLIMQGKITKVLNMKPKEILGMVEEAAGTRMYKTKKEQSLKTMEKKDLKLLEVDRQLNEELTPKIERLRQERAHYLELQKCVREIETLSRQDTAHKYHLCQMKAEETEGELQKMEKKGEKLEAATASGVAEAAQLEAGLRELEAAREREGGEGQLGALEAQLHEAVRAEAKMAAGRKNLEETAASDAKRRQQVLKSIKGDEKLLEGRAAAFAGGKDEFVAADAAGKQLTEALEAARKRHEAASMGMFVDEHGNASSLQQQAINAEKNAIGASTQTNILKMQIVQLKKELAAKKTELKNSTGQDIAQEKNTLKSLEDRLQKLQAQVEKEGGCDEAFEDAKQRLRGISREVDRLQEQISEGLRQFPWAQLQYEDPHPNFDRSKVSGLVCNLFSMRRPEFGVALETVAGGSLYNVVVDSEETAKALIRTSGVRRTYLPLNKLQSSSVAVQRAAAARRIAGNDNVWPAMELIEFEPRFRPVMERVFGSTLICKTQEIAKRLPFENQVNCSCVSLDGDSFSPSGVMSGGSTDKKKLLLPILDKSREARATLEQKQQELRQAERHNNETKQRVEALVQMRREVEEVSHRVRLCRESIANSNRGRLELENQELEKQMAAAEAELLTQAEILSKAQAKQKELEQLMKEGKAVAEREKKAAEKQLKTLQQQLEQHKLNTDAKIQEFSTLEAEMEELRASIEAARQEARDAAAAIEENEAQLEAGAGQMQEAKQAVQEVRALVAQEKERLNKQNKQMHSMNQRKDKLAKEQSDRELEMKKLKHAVDKIREEFGVVREQLARLERKYEWVASDKHLFGQKGGPYEFCEPDKVAEKLAALEGRRKGLEKRTNSNAQHVLAKVEEQLQELLKKKGIVESDRQKLKSVIQELDKKMVEALDVAWQKINEDFGAIFSTLLVGATAELRPTGRTNKILDGLEVHVGFNGQWKEGLSELSGGQRSLVALSLVLAMLQFKPAPIYILDEVDAALDPSHTENIGELVKKHFKQSQFIIVSLKDGMYKNATVLFKTKLVDGVSGVDRITKKK